MVASVQLFLSPLYESSTGNKRLALGDIFVWLCFTDQPLGSSIFVRNVPKVGLKRH